MKKIAQRLDEDDGEHRSGQRDVQQKPAATGEQAVQSLAVPAEMEAGDVVRDRLAGDGQRQAEKPDEGNGAVHQPEFARSLAQLPADDHLKAVMDERGQKAGGGKDDSALQ